MISPPKKAPGAGELTGQQMLIYLLVYHALDLLQTPFGFVFWMIEQRKARLHDGLANEGFPAMSDARRIKELLRERVAELSQYLFPHGHREGIHWCVGDVTGAPGKSFKICIAGEKAGLWGDFAESGKHSRSLLDLWMHAHEVDFKTALREAAEWLGVSLSLGVAQASEGPPSQKLNSRDATPIDWQRCVDAFTEKHLERLAEWRGYSIEFCFWLKQSRLVGLYDSCIAFPVHDRVGNVLAVHYRLKDGSWRYYPQGAKVRPLVVGELTAGDSVYIFESQWDAFAFMDVSGERASVVVTRGAGNGALAAGLISDRSPAYVWTQNDDAGEREQKDICANSKATIKRVRIPVPHKDLNDWTRSGASCTDLLDAMVNAEILREAEKSWTDALDEAVVTSSQLKNLTLKPRQKLFGDWFCEGDLGFIFAFRGVGKTWLALAIAQTLSAGGKLGDWPGHAPVKVLYIDGEMPPDLMRSRCKGLEAGNDNLQFLNHEILFERSGKVLNITNREIQEAITEKCIASGVKVLFLDNLSTLASGMRENEADSRELVNSWLLNLRRRRIAVVIVHHAGRSGEMRGTSKREDNVFWIIALDDAKKDADDKRGARFISRFTKPSRNTQEEVPAYEWHFVTDEPTGVVSIGCKLAQTMDVFLGLIEDGVTECAQISQEMKTSPASISRLAKRAIDAGKIIKRSREYFLAEGQKADKKP